MPEHNKADEKAAYKPVFQMDSFGERARVNRAQTHVRPDQVCFFEKGHGNSCASTRAMAGESVKGWK
ncbi:MAG: hypothetical protein CR997_07120 [Acidobacteria bacterium]|nr:MAG: hypothetical protein CR997_07120 [Acidobacteriota bacterium]